MDFLFLDPDGIEQPMGEIPKNGAIAPSEDTRDL